jgi:hypothetical protein
MRGNWRDRVRMGVVVLASSSLALAPGFAAAQSQGGSGQTSSESKPAGKSGSEANQKPANGTGSRTAQQSAGDVGDRLHDSAKGFGEAILGGIKYAGRKVINFFND